MPKRKLPPDKRQSVVKCCLKKHLALSAIEPGIVDLVDNVSRRVHRGALLLNHFLLWRLRDSGIADGVLSDQMLYYTALCVEGRGKKYPEVRAFFRDHSDKYEAVDALGGSSPCVNAAARTLKTNAVNMLFMLFDSRVRMLWKQRPKREQRAVLQRVRNFPSLVPMVLSREQWEFIDESRAALGVGDGTTVSDGWIKQHTGRVVTFMHSLLRRCEASGLPGFSLLPLSKHKRHFITLDAATLRNLMVRAGALRSDVDAKTFAALQADHFRSVFCYRRSWIVGTEVKTDGVALCLNVWRDDRATQRPESGVPRVARGEEYLAVDPGRANICSVVRVRDGEVLEKLRFTRKQYYTEGNVDRNRAKRARLDYSIRATLDDLSEHNKRTSCHIAFGEYLAAKRPHDPDLWRVGLDRRCAAWRMDTYIHCRSAVDRFWRRAVGKLTRPVIAYGDAAFSASGRGERAVPTRGMAIAASRHGRLAMVDEYNTTKCCCECGSVTRKVLSRVDGESREVRGLRRCESNACRTVPLKSRDYNAACNIACCVPTEGRPLRLQRSGDIVHSWRPDGLQCPYG